jgi:hypothetical protein
MHRPDYAVRTNLGARKEILLQTLIINSNSWTNVSSGLRTGGLWFINQLLGIQ